MFGTQNLTLFLISAILLNLTPGQDTLYIVGRSIAQGRAAGLLSAAGIIAGCMIHTSAAAFGLSAILAASAFAFTVVKWLGAGYLVYLGIRMFLQSPEATNPVPLARGNHWRIFRAGFLTNLLNPKVALFYLAFLPQFVDPAAASKIGVFLFLGAIFITTGTCWCLVLVFAASTIGARLRASRSIGSVVRRVTGALFIGLGIKLATAK